jgi:hypothetical protein
LASITLASAANPSHETRRHAPRNHALKNMTQDLALAEAAKPIHRERRMMRNLVLEIELAEPAVSEVQRHFLAQSALMTNTVAVTHQQHPDHQLGIDRGPAELRKTRYEHLFSDLHQITDIPPQQKKQWASAP